MKTRNGFVSNSSSSSFIVGYGIIKDRQKLEKELKKVNDNEYDCWYKIYNEGELYQAIEDNNYFHTWDNSDDPKDTLVIHAGNDTYITCTEDLSDKSFFVVHVNNDEGDGDFCVYDHKGDFVELDYSIVDEDYFDDDQQVLIGILKDDSILEKAQYKVGAERNG